MFGNTCLEAKHVGAHLMDQLKNEMRHLKAEKNKSFWIFTEPDTISLFCLLMYMYFLFILLPHLVLMFQSYNDNLFCGCRDIILLFLYDRT